MEKKDKTLEQIKNAALAAVSTLGTRLILPDRIRNTGNVVPQQDLDILIR